MRPLPTALWIAVALAACTVNPVTFRELPATVGGTITGLEGAGLVLTNQGGDDLEITGDGPFVFATPMERGAAYSVAVKRQPSNPTQSCTVTSGSGAVGEQGVTDVQVRCSLPGFQVGGTVTGLAGQGLVLQNHADDSLAVATDGVFAFATPLASGASYDVTVAMQPSAPTQVCTVARGTGEVAASEITDIEVTCATSAFTIGGTITGLASGNAIRLRNNGGDDLVRSQNGAFEFPVQVTSGQPYAVTIAADPISPVSQRCTATRNTGIVGNRTVTDVQITCTTNAFTIGGTITGAGAGVVLQNNGGDDLVIAQEGPFTFATPVLSGNTYAVTVKSQPASLTCSVTSGTGSVRAINITTVQITCTAFDWSQALFPIAVPGAIAPVGDLVLDNHGDLLISVFGTPNAIVRIDRLTGARATVATGIGNDLDFRGITYRAANDTIYANNFAGQIFAVTPAGSVSLLLSGPGQLNAIAMAPPSFGSFGGFIIGVTQTGAVFAVNPVSGAVTSITNSAGATSDLAFAPDGTLYLSGGATVRTVTAAGVVTPFAAGLSSADGLTITPDGTRIFIADSDTQTVRQVTIPGAVVTTFADAELSGGFAVSGILAAPGNTLIVMTGRNDLTLRAFAY